MLLYALLASDGSVEWYVPACLVVWTTVRDALIGDSETLSHVPTLLKHGKVSVWVNKAGVCRAVLRVDLKC